MKRVHVLISGKVQGVGFRYNIYRLALLNSIKGWVKNSGNDVEAVFEGENDAINKMLKFCEKGTFLAHVDKLDIKEERVIGEKKFKIL